VNVLITIDTEINPSEIDPPARLRANVERRIWGRAGGSEVGIAYQARTLHEAGLTGVFFVEALSASVIDRAMLRDWVAALQEHGQEVQLHVHAEWAQYLGIAPHPGTNGYNLFQYRRDDQKRLIGMGLENLVAAGARDVTAFRAGNYSASDETIEVLSDLGLSYDSSYNRMFLDAECRLTPVAQHNMPFRRGGCGVLPVTNFVDGLGKGRHAQLCACSAVEMRQALGNALQSALPAFVIVSHSFELLTEHGERASETVGRRWHALLTFLSQNRSTMPTTGFSDIDEAILDHEGHDDRLSVSKLATLGRLTSQLVGNVF
jgi:hypothetical protein